MRLYSVSVPSIRDPEYAKALRASVRQAPSAEVLRRIGTSLTGFEQLLASPTDPARMGLLLPEGPGATRTGRHASR